MKLPKLLLRKKLRASAARRSLGSPDEMEEMSEPNMKLSRALLIVLVLHVVAVAGILAFNTIKTRKGSPAPATPVPVTTTTVTAPGPSVASMVTPAMRDARRVEPPQLIAKDDRKPEIPKAVPVAAGAGESRKTYVVVKGDNPVSIAKKLKVSESDLLSINHIDDPRKLQIGQKLIIPAKLARPK